MKLARALTQFALAALFTVILIAQGMTQINGTIKGKDGKPL